ncbi:MAG TPA: DNA repair protein RadC [Spirochaetota bacterium]|nr:DNA repair protein RadC [Spirochaetota bacterium]HQO00886.1 DNA repair protein RadC [Spirochaetota bacterium]HQP47667.1 DNA repair protein RadC [Spirochaetota bacterium]
MHFLMEGDAAMKDTLSKIKDAMPVQKCIAGEDVRGLSDQELMSVVLGTGSRNRDVLDLANELLVRFGGLHGLHTTGLREMSLVQGVGLTRAVRVRAALEMGRRILGEEKRVMVMDSPASVWKFIRHDIIELKREEFRVFILNNKNHLLKHSVISVGTVSEAVVHPREVFMEAIREAGSAVIIAHNHPSGVLSPSREDIAATERMKNAGEIIGIPLLDHIIVSDRSYLSLKEEGYL